MPISLRTLCLVTLVLCNIHGSLEHEIPRRSFLSRRAIDGTRGRKFFDPEEEGTFDSYGSAGGQYDPYEERTDFSDIRRNVPGEPGVDYPAYTTLPQTGFTCEGRSRGYYADVVAGCQVFHVCHDVLVSSFLCPIGSTFSQKLLTCDWWTKVDCSSSEKYIDVNRNSYQQDDDEMIRNAYAMVSLQSGTDVTKDGLVDPDRTGSVVDYQRGSGRILDYTPMDSTGNDLRTNFEDYPRPAVHDFLPPYQFKTRKPETSHSYQERFYHREKSRSPYQDSPIIRVQKLNDRGHVDQQRSRDFQGSYRRPNEFSDQFQPSYAPTVPTVTTTTRRFYSPTVPTTYRPSTLAYDKLDQDIDSSDYFFSHSGTKSYVTPPTRFPSNEESRGSFEQDSKKTDYHSRKIDRDDYNQQERYEDYGDASSEEEKRGRSQETFQVRVAEDLRFNQSNIQAERSPLFDEPYQGYQDEESVDDIEPRGSIGLGHALRQPFRGISVQEQNPVSDKAKGGGFDSVVGSRPNATVPREEKGRTGYQFLGRTEPTASVDDPETTEQYQRDDQRHSETFVPSTTPSYVESTIRASTIDSSRHEAINPSATTASGDSKSNLTDASSESTKERDAEDRVDTGLHTFRPPDILEPPEATSKFQINVPDLSEVSSLLVRYSSLDNGPNPGMRTTTELPRFQSSYADDYGQSTGYDAGDTNNYNSRGASRVSSPQYYPTTQAKSLISSHSRLSSSSSGNLEPEIPRDVSSSIANHSHDLNESEPFSTKNETEEKIVDDYTRPQFTVRVSSSQYYHTTQAKSLISSHSQLSSTSSGNLEREIPKDASSPIANHSHDLNKSEPLNTKEEKKNEEEEKIVDDYTRPQFTVRVSSSQYSPTTQAKSPISSTHLPSLDNLSPGIPRDVSSPVNYKRDDSSASKSGLALVTINKTEEKIVDDYNPQFSIRDSSQGPCSTQSDRPCNSTSIRGNSVPTLATLIQSRLTKVPTISSGSPTSTGSTIGPAFVEISTQPSKSTPISLVTKTGNLEFLEPISKPVAHRSVGKSNEKLETSTLKGETIESSTVNALLGSIKPDTLKQIEESIDKSNSPYQVTLTVNKDEQLVPTGGDLISKLISNQGKGSSILSDSVHELEIIKSVDPETRSTADLQTTTVNTLEVSEQPTTENTFTTTESTKRSFGTVSLLQLMSELLKLDRAPRPFSLSAQKPERTQTRATLQAKTIAKDVNFSMQLDESAKFPDSSTESVAKTPLPLLKERILGQLMENFGEPIYRANRQPIFELPKEERLLDFQTGLPFTSSNKRNESSSVGTSSTTAKAFSEEASTTTTTTTPKTTLTTEPTKTVVKTELVPSIGFSLDTDEGREEYVEAVLGGLIEPQPAESEKKETTVSEKIEEPPKNETSVTV